MSEAWARPTIPVLPGRGDVPRLYDTATDERRTTPNSGDTARLYVCGITPYDSTHLGHASTYLVFDILQRVWIDAGLTVRYAQNVTDVDDPLLERAAATGVDWRDLAAEQTQLFRDDMAALRALPPTDFVAVTDVIDEVADAVAVLRAAGVAYPIDTPDSAGDDLYFDIAAAQRSTSWWLGEESRYDRATMLALSAERGGDPERPGKRDALDPLLWRAERAGEPAWDSAVGRGRPGWHIECSVIALDRLGADFAVQGGGSDLRFPHHEFSAGHAAALGGRFAQVYSHTGLVAYQGEKMSKSLGNLVFVSGLRREGVPVGAIRLVVLAQHYRTDWEYTETALHAARARLEVWRAIRTVADGVRAMDLLAEVRDRLADDLDTPGALAAIDRAAETGVDDPGLVRDLVDALLGVSLR
jgi:L-cysteine:1D-myo-inositol 2-amino-2-deoxy-alpha-D-glucopyranoside ligase